VNLHLLGDQVLQQRIVNGLRHTQAPDEHTPFLIAGVLPEQMEKIRHLIPESHKQSAVLVPLIQRPDGLSVLFTERASHLRNHAGQISFPGGRIEDTDADPIAAALRETEEEIGLSRRYIQPIGYLPPYLVLTGYRIIPVVALVQADFTLTLDAGEVASAFETPLTYLLNPAHHAARERQIGEITVHAYDISYGERCIWGATAGMVMSLYRMLLAQSEGI
jgi:8-oxo-dGTP pyrophosphatase MutT (NUDIX family)